MSEALEEPVVLVSSAEFALKSTPVRRSMEQRLIDDLKFALRNIGIENAKIGKDAGRIVVTSISDSAAVTAACSKVFGVAYAAPATKVNGSIESIKRQIVQLAKEKILQGESFAIRCHRSAPSNTSRRQVEVEAGAEVLKALQERMVRVKLNHPDRTIFADLSGENTYVYSQKTPGPGGLPISSQWKMLAILDSGPLSIFSAFVLMKRGCLVQLLIPHVEETSIDRQLALAHELRRFVTREKHNTIIMHIESKSCSPSLIRLLSLDIAIKKRFRGVIFSDLSGQLSNNHVLTSKARKVGLPIFQPLIGFGKAELEELCRIFNLDRSELTMNVAIDNREVLPSDLPGFSLEEVSL